MSCLIGSRPSSRRSDRFDGCRPTRRSGRSLSKRTRLPNRQTGIRSNGQAGEILEAFDTARYRGKEPLGAGIVGRDGANVLHQLGTGLLADAGKWPTTVFEQEVEDCRRCHDISLALRLVDDRSCRCVPLLHLDIRDAFARQNINQMDHHHVRGVAGA